MKLNAHSIINNVEINLQAKHDAYLTSRQVKEAIVALTEAVNEQITDLNEQIVGLKDEVDFLRSHLKVTYNK